METLGYTLAALFLLGITGVGLTVRWAVKAMDEDEEMMNRKREGYTRNDG